MKFFPKGRAALPRGLYFRRRGSAALPLAAAVLFSASSVMAQTTNALSDAELTGRQLAQQLCNGHPTQGLNSTGTLQIRDGKGVRVEIPVQFEILIAPMNWTSIDRVVSTNKQPAGIPGDYFEIIHNNRQPNLYIKHVIGRLDDTGSAMNSFPTNRILSGEEAMIPFAQSDFWIADLGLEFFHWPAQKILKKENRRGRGCQVLESTNPNLSSNGYSRVVSWIDEETGGIVHAEAFDAQNNLLKEFDPKSFKKVNGQWELRDMEIRNVQTGSRTRIQFDLKPG
jgi:hypothetical protein